MRALSLTLAALIAISFFVLVPTAACGQGWLSLGGPGAADEALIEQALAKRGSLEFVETPLAAAVSAIGQEFGIPVVIAAKRLDEAGVSPDRPITKSLVDLPLESILRLVLEEVDLTFTIRNSALVVTTPEDTEGHLITRVYPVLDLVVPRGTPVNSATAASEADYDSLIELLKATVSPESWDDVGGPGAIDALDNAAALVVSQTLQVHRALAGLLEALRSIRERQGITAFPVPRIRRFEVDSADLLPTARTLRPTAIQRWQLPRIHSDGD